MAGAALDKALLDILTDPDTGTPEDKMRLFLIYFICTDIIPEVRSFTFTIFLNEEECIRAVQL